MRVSRPGPGTPVTVVGLAKSGAAAARWLLQIEASVRVTEVGVSPSLREAADALTGAGVQVEIGKHSREFVEGSRLLVVSPGVPMTAKPVQWAKEAGIPVVGEMELGSWYCSGRLVAVTGSNGKSTVVTLLGEILRAAGRDALVCGNIGNPLCGELGRIGRSTIVILEVSSFQLETSLAFHAEIGCVLNVTDNHLDRHGSFTDYQKAKARLFAHQRLNSWAVLNADDPGSIGLKTTVQGRLAAFSRTQRVEGGCLLNDQLQLTLPSLSGPICRPAQLPKQGAHHEENALAASLIAGLLGIAPEISGSVLQSFEGLPHRQQVVATVRGITFVNDSKSTTVASGLRAIQAARGKVILIAGGRDKGSDFRKLRPWTKKLRAAVLFGEDGHRIATALQGAVAVREARDLEEAVAIAYGMAREQECVLLSPMCTSFDMFRDFEERGEKFSEAVRGIACGV
ncbi:MAG: UDP-N-acetylmuramoyl-L-alanine--D-glutamate ligase [Candidatus Omnitrophica bacterium]|nr:UDP-N-acetylmuramoyl-L-alanine--D-glutamate ligase [Candidatus Omnitrophota bacterium]